MNIEKIYTAVENDEMNSPLITICNAIFNQGYSLKIDGIDIDRDDLDNSVLVDFEQSQNNFNLLLTDVKNQSVEFVLTFTDYHKFILTEKMV